MQQQRGVVLVVDDDPRVAEVYAEQLRQRHTVRVAYSGSDALESLDDDVDVVLLDRRMPGQTGDEVLERIRDRGLNCQVAMVTAVEPDFDIIEMDFDDYLFKPVTGEKLLSTVDHLLGRANYDAALREFFAVAAKRAALKAEKPDAVLDRNEQYRELTARFEQLRAELGRALESLDDEEAFDLALSYRP